MTKSYLQVHLNTCCTGRCFQFDPQRFHSLVKLSLSCIQLHYIAVKALFVCIYFERTNQERRLAMVDLASHNRLKQQVKRK